MTPHHIRKVVFDLEWPDKEAAQAAFNQLSSLFQQKITERLETVLDRHQIEGFVVQFDRIQLDLGDLSAADWETELPDRLDRALDQYLQNWIQQNQLKQKARSTSILARSEIRQFEGDELQSGSFYREARSDLEALSSFYKNGYFPARITDQVDSLQLLLEKTIQQSPQLLIQSLQRLWAEPRVQTRFLHQTPRLLLVQIAGLLQDENVHPDELPPPIAAALFGPKPVQLTMADNRTPVEGGMQQPSGEPAGPQSPTPPKEKPQSQSATVDAERPAAPLGDQPETRTEAHHLSSSDPERIAPEKDASMSATPEPPSPQNRKEVVSEQEQSHTPPSSEIKTQEEVATTSTQEEVATTPKEEAAPPAPKAVRQSRKPGETGSEKEGLVPEQPSQASPDGSAKEEAEASAASEKQQPSGPIQKPKGEPELPASTDDPASAPELQAESELLKQAVANPADPPRREEPVPSEPVETADEATVLQVNPADMAAFEVEEADPKSEKSSLTIEPEVSLSLILQVLDEGHLPEEVPFEGTWTAYLSTQVPALIQAYGHRLVELILPHLKKRHTKPAYLSVLEALEQAFRTASPQLRQQTSVQRLLKTLQLRLQLSADSETSAAPKTPPVWVSPPKHQSRVGSVLPGDESFFVKNAGAVILWPFLTTYFQHLELLDARKQFKDTAAAELGVHLVEYLATRHTNTPEHLLLFNKVLCGLPIEHPIPKEVRLPEGAEAVGESLLRAVIQQWSALKNTSEDGLRGGFLIRDGHLKRDEGNWKIVVEKKPFDLLVERLPWSLNMIRLPWNAYFIYTEWR